MSSDKNNTAGAEAMNSSQKPGMQPTVGSWMASMMNKTSANGPSSADTIGLKYHLGKIQSLADDDNARIKQLESALKTAEAENQELSEDLGTALAKPQGFVDEERWNALRTDFQKQVDEVNEKADKMASASKERLWRRDDRIKCQEQRITELELEKDELEVLAQADAIEFKMKNEDLREQVATLQQQCANAEATYEKALKREHSKQEETSRKLKELLRNPQGQNNLQKQYIKDQENKHRRVCENFEARYKTAHDGNSDLEKRLRDLQENDKYLRREAYRYEALYCRDRHPQWHGTPQATSGDISLEAELDGALADNAQLQREIDDYKNGYNKEEHDEEEYDEEEDDEDEDSEAQPAEETKPLTKDRRANDFPELPLKPTDTQPANLLIESAETALPESIAALQEELKTANVEICRLQKEIENLKDAKALPIRNDELTAKVKELQKRDQRASRIRGVLLEHALRINQESIKDHISRRAFGDIVRMLRVNEKEANE